jgi:hypothetical protein
MMARRTMFGVLVGSIAALLSGCNPFARNPNYRFRMTVEVETPAGVKAVSSVYDVITQNYIKTLPDAATRSIGLRGEALVLDAPGGPVFVLLRTDSANSDSNLAMASMVALDPEYKNDWVESAGRISESWSTLKGELPRTVTNFRGEQVSNWPLMVRFRDIDDPKSVEQVDPAQIGVKRITLETTSDDVTVGIQKRLRWLSNQDGSFVQRLSVADPTNPPIAALLSNGDFSTEIK